MMGCVAMETAGMASANARRGDEQTECQGLGSVKIQIKQNGTGVEVGRLIRKYLRWAKNLG